MAPKKPSGRRKHATSKREDGSGKRPAYPRHSVEKSLRIPAAILDQNAGKECSDKDAARFLGLGSAAGPFNVEISSASKYGFLERPGSKRLVVTDLAKKAIRPQDEGDRIDALRQALLHFRRNRPLRANCYL